MTVRLSDGRAAYEWSTRIAFSDAKARYPVLGWTRFLEYFTTMFKGDTWRVNFEPNKDFPGTYESRNSSDGS